MLHAKNIPTIKGNPTLSIIPILFPFMLFCCFNNILFPSILVYSSHTIDAKERKMLYDSKNHPDKRRQM